MSVTHNAALSRYEMKTDHGLALAVYRQQGDSLVFTHTEVPQADDFVLPIGRARIDHAFTDLDRDQGGHAQVLLRCRGAETRIWLDRAFGFVQVFTGATIADDARRRRAVAVEPNSCAPNAFNSGDGLRLLAPGESFEARWGVTTT